MIDKDTRGMNVGLSAGLDADDFYLSDGSPVRCPECLREQFLETVRATAGDGIAAEVEYRCAQGGSIVGYWAYGHFDPAYRDALTASNDALKRGP